jgi:hypothetical protein
MELKAEFKKNRTQNSELQESATPPASRLSRNEKQFIKRAKSIKPEGHHASFWLAKF